MVIKFINAFRKLFRKHIYAFGDSHTKAFAYINKAILSETKFVVTRVDGATAMGMVNPNSNTNALPTFMTSIEQLPKSSKLLFLLGEVDCGFLIWFRHYSMNIEVEEQLNKSVKNYALFLERILKSGYKDIGVLSSPLPAVTDEYIDVQANNMRRQINVPHIERTQLALRYNAKLKAACQTLGIKYIDMDSDLYDPVKRIVEAKYFAEDPSDHHLKESTYANLVMEHLKKYKII